MHKAIVTVDYASLKRILVGLPWLCNPTKIRRASISLAKVEKVDAIAAVIGVGMWRNFGWQKG